MKKSIVCALLFCIICLLAGCGEQQESQSGDYMHLTIPDADTIIVYSASGDKDIELTDTDMIRAITNSFSAVAFEKDKASNNLAGFGTRIQWCDKNDIVLSLSVLGKHEIEYDGYYWKAVDGSVDVDLLNVLWETEQAEESSESSSE